MRRRTARTSFPLQLILAAILVFLAGTVAACGDGDGGGGPSPTSDGTTAVPMPSASPSPSGTTAGSTRISVYFLRGEKLGVAERAVPRTQAVAAAALRELCAGPTEAEQEAGLGTAIPEGTELRSVALRDGILFVDLSSQYASGGGSLSMMARVAQVVYTATQFKTIEGVRFLLDGQAINELGGEGVIVSPAQKRADWVEFEPAIFVEHPAVGSVLRSPFVLRGTASVFEASFLAELHDDGGRLVRSIVTASEGAPGRGTFRRTIRFTSSAEEGELVVYDVSMEDGSRQNEVRIPVRFER